MANLPARPSMAKSSTPAWMSEGSSLKVVASPQRGGTRDRRSPRPPDTPRAVAAELAPLRRPAHPLQDWEQPLQSRDRGVLMLERALGSSDQVKSPGLIFACTDRSDMRKTKTWWSSMSAWRPSASSASRLLPSLEQCLEPYACKLRLALVRWRCHQEVDFELLRGRHQRACWYRISLSRDTPPSGRGLSSTVRAVGATAVSVPRRSSVSTLGYRHERVEPHAHRAPGGSRGMSGNPRGGTGSAGSRPQVIPLRRDLVAQWIVEERMHAEPWLPVIPILPCRVILIRKPEERVVMRHVRSEECHDRLVHDRERRPRRGEVRVLDDLLAGKSHAIGAARAWSRTCRGAALLRCEEG